MHGVSTKGPLTLNIFYCTITIGLTTYKMDIQLTFMKRLNFDMNMF